MTLIMKQFQIFDVYKPKSFFSLFRLRLGMFDFSRSRPFSASAGDVNFKPVTLNIWTAYDAF